MYYMYFIMQGCRPSNMHNDDDEHFYTLILNLIITTCILITTTKLNSWLLAKRT